MLATMSARPPVHLIDASIYVFRAYFSVAPEFVDVEDRPVHAVFGFLNTLMTLLHDEKPGHLAVCFDESLTTSFRNRLYPPYKANRELPPADLSAQFDYCKQLCQALGLRDKLRRPLPVRRRAGIGGERGGAQGCHVQRVTADGVAG